MNGKAGTGANRRAVGFPGKYGDGVAEVGLYRNAVGSGRQNSKIGRRGIGFYVTPGGEYRGAHGRN